MQRLAADTLPAVPYERFLVHHGRALLQDGSTTLEGCEIYQGGRLYLLPVMQIYLSNLSSDWPCPEP